MVVFRAVTALVSYTVCIITRHRPLIALPQSVHCIEDIDTVENITGTVKSIITDSAMSIKYIVKNTGAVKSIVDTVKSIKLYRQKNTYC